MSQSSTLDIGLDVHNDALAVASVAKDHDTKGDDLGNLRRDSGTSSNASGRCSPAEVITTLRLGHCRQRERRRSGATVLFVKGALDVRR